MTDFAEYEARINATNYALTHDDGIDVNYADADVILVGVSRVGQDADLPVHGAALRREGRELSADRRRSRVAIELPPTPASATAQAVRPDHRPGAPAADPAGAPAAIHATQLETCKRELAAAEAMFRREGIAVLSTTHTSIEEISSRVLEDLGINREMF